MAVVELYAEQGFFRKGSMGFIQPETLEEACPDRISLEVDSSETSRVAVVAFADRSSARQALVRLWELRLLGRHELSAVLTCDSSEERDSLLKPVFVAHINALLEGDLVREHEDLERMLEVKINDIRWKMRRHRSIKKFQDLKSLRDDLCFQSQQTSLKVHEFKKSLKSFAALVSNRGKESIGSDVFYLRYCWSWSQLHCLIQRECERLRKQLPTYARRSKIISQLNSYQVVVLVGETGSGKSTQIVQYLYDAGYGGCGKSIVCTQPRKVAARKLAQRVEEECGGCYSLYSVDCVLGYSSRNYAQVADVTFTTDFVLLQFCLIDPLLHNFSCVVVDEAHERSMNTDLLLAMLKSACSRRSDLKVIIMSATADAELLSAYFGVGEVLCIPGRTFPVQIIFDPITHVENWIDEYMNKVLAKVRYIHEDESDGNILAFLTSPSEVEWACSQITVTSALVLPLHGKLEQEDLQKVFQPDIPGRRKIIFATNFAETSLTIPNVRYVVDCGLVKESLFDSRKGMNVLEVNTIDQSSAIQRSGRAGRTRPGVCYRLYGESDFENFAAHKLPEVKRVHLAVAILKLLGLGIKDIENFDFVEAPDPRAIQVALRVLEQLGAVKCETGSNGRYLTELGTKLVKLAIEPRLGKILLDSINVGYGQEGLVMVALMSHSGSVFYRAGTTLARERADLLKMRFCHPDGELFTLMAVYREWESQPERYRNRWCLQNAVSSKTMKRCHDQVLELNQCLRYQLEIYVPYRYRWSPTHVKNSNATLRKILFGALVSNLAVFTGHERLGYSDVLSGQKAFLHPSSSILVFGVCPDFVVYGEILQSSKTFLDLVMAVEPEWISALPKSVPYDLTALEASIMRQWILPVVSSSFLTRLSGKQCQNLARLRIAIQEQHKEECVIDVSYEKNTLAIFTTPKQMDAAKKLSLNLVKREKRRLQNESLECLVVTTSSGPQSPSMIIGAGATILDILMPADSATVEILYRSCHAFEENNSELGQDGIVDGQVASKEDENERMVEIFDMCGDGLAGFERSSCVGEKSSELLKWGTIRYKSSNNARMAVEHLNGLGLSKSKVILTVRIVEDSSPKTYDKALLPAVKATLAWARRKRKGWAVVKCEPDHALTILETVRNSAECAELGFSIKLDRTKENSLVVMGLPDTVDEAILHDTLSKVSECKILDCYMPRAPAPIQPSGKRQQESISQVICRSVPREKFHVFLWEPKEKDYNCRAEIRFDESVHEEASRGLENLEGLILPGCSSWQAITCRRMFSSQVHIPRLLCGVLKQDLEELIAALRRKYTDANINVSSRPSGALRVQVSGSSLAAVAQCKCSLEKLMEGQAIEGEDLAESVVRLLFTKRGAQISKAVESQTGTLVWCDKRMQSAKIYGPPLRKATALKELVLELKKLDVTAKSHQIALRGDGIPPGLMREVVKTYGPNLQSLCLLAGDDVKITIDHRSHILFISGGDTDAIDKVHICISDVLQKLKTAPSALLTDDNEHCHPWKMAVEECPICFSPMEDKYSLENCGHSFCRSCVVAQILSSTRHKDGFPLRCAHEDCSDLLMISDLLRVLSAAQRDDLFRASLSAFVAQHPSSYRFCTTADCPNVYRVTETGDCFLCAACSASICTACHVEFHEHLSCEEYQRYKLDPDISLQAWRKGKVDVKNCPSCGSVIEKVDGCDHMTCRCGQHVCWICLMTFQESGPCYEHLRTHERYPFEEDDVENIVNAE